jgi:hypothetical protein
MRRALMIEEGRCAHLRPAPRVVSPSDARRRVSRLLNEVVAARGRVQARLVERGGCPDAIDKARIGNLHALMDYATAIESLSWPVPRNILMEIKLHQALCSSPSRGVRRVDSCAVLSASPEAASRSLPF